MIRRALVLITIYSIAITSFANQELRPPKSSSMNRVKRLINTFNSNESEYIKTVTKIVEGQYKSEEDKLFFKKVLDHRHQANIRPKIEVIGKNIKFTYQNRSFLLGKFNLKNRSFVVGNTEVALSENESLKITISKLGAVIRDELKTANKLNLLIQDAHAISYGAIFLVIAASLFILPMVLDFFKGGDKYDLSNRAPKPTYKMSPRARKVEREKQKTDSLEMKKQAITLAGINFLVLSIAPPETEFQQLFDIAAFNGIAGVVALDGFATHMIKKYGEEYDISNSCNNEEFSLNAFKFVRDVHQTAAAVALKLSILYQRLHGLYTTIEFMAVCEHMTQIYKADQFALSGKAMDVSDSVNSGLIPITTKSYNLYFKDSPYSQDARGFGLLFNRVFPPMTSARNNLAVNIQNLLTIFEEVKGSYTELWPAKIVEYSGVARKISKSLSEYYHEQSLIAKSVASSFDEIAADIVKKTRPNEIKDLEGDALTNKIQEIMKGVEFESLKSCIKKVEVVNTQQDTKDKDDVYDVSNLCIGGNYFSIPKLGLENFLNKCFLNEAPMNYINHCSKTPQKFFEDVIKEAQLVTASMMQGNYSVKKVQSKDKKINFYLSKELKGYHKSINTCTDKLVNKYGKVMKGLLRGENYTKVDSKTVFDIDVQKYVDFLVSPTVENQLLTGPFGQNGYLTFLDQKTEECMDNTNLPESLPSEPSAFTAKTLPGAPGTGFVEIVPTGNFYYNNRTYGTYGVPEMQGFVDSMGSKLNYRLRISDISNSDGSKLCWPVAGGEQCHKTHRDGRALDISGRLPSGENIFDDYDKSKEIIMQSIDSGAKRVIYSDPKCEQLLRDLPNSYSDKLDCLGGHKDHLHIEI